MVKRSCFVVYILFNINCIYAEGIQQYETPNLDDQFDNFQITKPTPVYGNASGGDPQNAITLTNRSYITFNFKGRGNAFLFGQEVDGVKDIHSFTIEIGGNSSNDRLAIYNLTSTENTDLLAERRISGVASETEYRSYWLFWDTFNGRVSVGICNKPDDEQVILRSPAFLYYSINHISISTNNKNNGSWEFGSDRHLFGACGYSTPDCLWETNCNNVYNSSTRSTCMPIPEAEPEFGNGNCLYVCGQSLCPSQGDCSENEVCESGGNGGPLEDLSYESTPIMTLSQSYYKESTGSVSSLPIHVTKYTRPSSTIQKSTNATFTTLRSTMISHIPTPLSFVTDSSSSSICSMTTETASILALASFGSTESSFITASISHVVPYKVTVSSPMTSYPLTPMTTTLSSLMNMKTNSISTNTMGTSIKWITIDIPESTSETSLSRLTETSVSINTNISGPQSISAIFVLNKSSAVNLTRFGLAKTPFTTNSNRNNFFTDADKVAAIAAAGSVAVLCLGGLIVYAACTRCHLYPVVPVAASADETKEDEETHRAEADY